MTASDVAVHDLAAAAGKLGVDELRVLVRIAERLAAGATSYGLMHLASDTRQFRAKEAREEMEDFLVYMACHWLKTSEKAQ